MTLNILIIGWLNIPHSYAIVNCFQIIHLIKKYNDKINIYTKEYKYYNPDWYNKKKLVYTKEYNEIITQLKEWNNEKIDLIYNITYPYDLTMVPNIPKCVFFTAEFSNLNESYFVMDNISQLTNSNLYFTSPSKWSNDGILNLNKNIKTKIITHGVDNTLLYKNHSNRNKMRKFYNIDLNDIVLLNIGAMTGNKGIQFILQAMYILIHVYNHKNYKLVLKGSGDLYKSQEMIKSYMNIFLNNKSIDKKLFTEMIENNIIFIDKTFTYEVLNDIFNMCDLYISPYLAEGFNLTVLEALACGLPVIVPETGSTMEYINDIAKNSNNFIYKIKSNVITDSIGNKSNYIDIQELMNSINNFQTNRKNITQSNYTELKKYLELNYDWSIIVKYLYEYFNFIVNK
jgi:glycosyltransferase involved in cell wall biosynthesis